MDGIDQLRRNHTRVCFAGAIGEARRGRPPEEPVVSIARAVHQPAAVVAPPTVHTPPATAAAAQSVIVTYENCAAVWAALGGPIHRGDPGYNTDLDGNDDDGIGCETRPR